MAASAVRRMGLKQTAPASSNLAQGVTLTGALANEIIQENRVAHDDAGERDEADHRGRGRRRAEKASVQT